MMQLTQHFTLEELTKTNKRDFKIINSREGMKILGKMYNLAAFAENVRLVIGEVPMIINSGFRCEALNKELGGVKTSQHVKAEAIDFVCNCVEPKKLFNVIKKSKLEFGQLILEQDSWIHISMGSKRECLVYDGTKYKKVN